jgi:hypothetical protein
VVLLGDDKDVRGGLRVEIAESDRPATFGHQLGRDVTRHDLAEEAVRHGGILACAAAQGTRRLSSYGSHDRLSAYIVDSLRSCGARLRDAWPGMCIFRLCTRGATSGRGHGNARHAKVRCWGSESLRSGCGRGNVSQFQHDHR